MPQEKPILDNEATERLPRIISIIKPMPIPSAAWDEEPTRCVRINAEWISHILGVMDGLDQPDAWQGTEAEIFDARQQVKEIMLALSGETNCEECEEMPAEYVKHIDFCTSETPGIVTMTKVIDGVEIVSEWSLNQCLNTIENVQCNETGLTITRNEYGVTDTYDIDFAACGIPVQGEPGAPGVDGADGADGVCPECGEQIPPTITSDDNSCSIAYYVVNWMDARFDDLLNGWELAGGVLDIVSAFLESIPGVGVVGGAVVDVVSSFVGITSAVLRAGVSSTVLEDWRCSLFCDIQGKATYGSIDLQAWITAELALAAGNPGRMTWLGTLQSMTNDELNLRLSVGAAATNTECDTLCDCDGEPGLPCDGDLIDLKTDNTTYVRRQSFVSAFHYGNWVSGQGWEMADGYNPSNGATTTPPGLIITRDYGATPIHIRYVHVTIKAKIAMSTSRVVQVIQVSNEAGTTIGTTLSQNTGTRAANEVFTLTFEFTNAALNHYENTVRISAPATIAEMYVQEIQVECW